MASDVHESPRLRIWWMLLFASMVLLFFCAFDWEIWHAVRMPNARVQYTSHGEHVVALIPAIERLRASSLYQLFRQAGYLPTWIVIAVAMSLHGLVRAGRQIPGPHETRYLQRAWAPPLAGALAGLLAAVIAGIVRKSRPGDLGLVHFDWPIGSRAGEGLGFPSSHAAVAAGAAFMIARLFPGSGWITIPVALACGYTRMEAGAHFASDVFGGFMVGWVGAVLAGKVLRLKA